MLFIIIHQVYELWFKVTLQELEYLRENLGKDDVPHAYATLKRVLTILKTCVSQIDVLETMTPLSFKSFRSRLESGSGFQSRQFRELEIILGRRDEAVVGIHHYDAAAVDILRRRLAEPSIWDAFIGFLSRRMEGVPAEVVERDVRQPYHSNTDVQAVLMRGYQDDPELTMLCERLVDLDEGLQEWRYRHVKMVERTLGAKPGTGGSAGAEYLRSTLFKPLFADLWAIRSEF
jgi:tryptophan 2,3-dioxygenase